MIPLNDEQLYAIRAPSPVFVNAAAGSGKTRTLVAKIMSLLESGVPPTRICAVTFTNKAANEMKERLRVNHDITGMQVSTIHSMCVRIIKNFPGYTYLKVPFSIYDDGDQVSVIKTILKARDMKDSPYDYLSKISSHKSEGTLPDNDPLKSIMAQYQEILKRNNACDFDDLLLFSHECLQHEDCRNRFTGLWRHLLVDEFQDTSEIQYKIIMSLYNPLISQTMFAVGDANQSVYGWRGARPDNVERFIKEHNAGVCYLTYNYRSCPQIIAQANHYQQFGKPMVAKSDTRGLVSCTAFEDHEKEAQKVVQAIIKMGSYESIAILYRVNARSLFFERELARFRVPYKVVGDLPFYRRRVVKDLLAALRAANNPSDIESLVRIINNPRRGFGAAKMEQLFLHGRSYVEQISDQMPAIKNFLKILNDIKGLGPENALNEYLNRTGYRETLTKDSDLNMVSALMDVVGGFSSVDELLLAATFLEEDTGRGVKLMTAHASKGMEFDRVFVVGVEQELWPHKNAEDLEEEKRLFYVALTRARKFLNVSYSRSRLYRGSPIPTQASQLFRQIYKHIYKG